MYNVHFRVPSLLGRTSSGKAREKKATAYREVIFDGLFQSRPILCPRQSRQLLRSYDIQRIRSQVRDETFIRHRLRKEEWKVLQPGLERLLRLLFPEYLVFVSLSIPCSFAR